MRNGVRNGGHPQSAGVLEWNGEWNGGMVDTHGVEPTEWNGNDGNGGMVENGGHPWNYIWNYMEFGIWRGMVRNGAGMGKDEMGERRCWRKVRRSAEGSAVSREV